MAISLSWLAQFTIPAAASSSSYSAAQSLMQQFGFSACAGSSRLKPSSSLTQHWVRTRAADESTKPQESQQSWFFKTFVAKNTMEAKLNKFKSDVAARNGFVGSWFDDSFKYTAWVEVHRKLTEGNLKSLECEEAHKLVKAGKAVLIDVREPQDFRKTHAEGAFNAPLFRLIQGNDLKTNLRRLGYALLTDFAGTERNPDFISQALAAVGGDRSKQVIVLCSIGGTLLTYVERTGPKAKRYADPERMFGRQSRSLKAAYELQEENFTNVTHLKGGLNDWIHEGYPVNEDED
ncbi:hypothetical protein O6H91_19G032000 [Diphasiastrum complanatum]|uniref:Uncharacterized protein n=1 Tax=Diphasiastrum complanatum TaxID=34168 RepID=A0ACC2AV99_DIPCM|nr:hypothetical protein O6H91_19G032000 [Diphasiastrum complanatum]